MLVEPRRLAGLAGSEEILLDKGVEVAIEHSIDIPHLQVGAMVFDQPIRMQDVRPDLVSPGDVFLALGILFEPLRTLLFLDLIET